MFVSCIDDAHYFFLLMSPLHASNISGILLVTVISSFSESDLTEKIENVLDRKQGSFIQIYSAVLEESKKLFLAVNIT